MRPRTRSFLKFFLLVPAVVVVLLFFNEFLIYYVTLFKCAWPEISKASAEGATAVTSPLNALVLADTHLLGPVNGHPFDRLRREWQMERAFQTAMTLFKPEAVFLLGDAFDEGTMVGWIHWNEYLQRFRSIFRRDVNVPLVVVPGNHDIGFHYVVKALPILRRRFDDIYEVDDVGVLVLKNVSFVLLNSMAFEGDDCDLCLRAERQLQSIAKDLRCVREPDKNCVPKRSLPSAHPVLLQHFPLFRKSDAGCSEPDEAPPSEKNVAMKQNWDCLSRRATDRLLTLLGPRLVFSAHTHNGCLTNHAARRKNSPPVPEYSVSSFSWRNRNNPAFLLARFTPTDYAVEKCLMPQESVVIGIYVAGCVVLVTYALYLTIPWRRVLDIFKNLRKQKSVKSQ